MRGSVAVALSALLAVVVVVVQVGEGVSVRSLYVPTNHTHPWGYGDDDVGPEGWGATPAYALCASGTQQSPIDLPDPGATEDATFALPELQLESGPTDVVNDGRVVQMKMPRSGEMGFRDKRYTFDGILIHVPAEHTVGGREFDAELQLVFNTPEGRLLLMSVLGVAGEENAALQEFLDFVPSNPLEVSADVDVSPKAFLPPGDLNYFYYLGSLTQPPCSEGVEWVVFKTPVPIAPRQLDLLRQAVGGIPNNRPIQVLGERTVSVSALHVSRATRTGQTSHAEVGPPVSPEHPSGLLESLLAQHTVLAPPAAPSSAPSVSPVPSPDPSPVPSSPPSSFFSPGPPRQPRHDYTYDPAALNGPAHWGRVLAAWRPCEVGLAQSPIDVAGATVNTALPPLDFTGYVNTQMILVHNGHGLQGVVAKGSDLHVGGQSYELLSFLVHTPSEHLINGNASPLEIQLVHTGADGSLAIVAVLFNVGHSNGLLEKLWDTLPHKEQEEGEPQEALNLAALLPWDHNYYRYEGSLTSPPCTEKVLWFVMRSAADVSQEQVDTLRRVFGTNARPAQPLHNRVVEVTNFAVDMPPREDSDLEEEEGWTNISF